RRARVRPDVPPELEAVVMRAMGRDGDDRPRAMAEFGRELTAQATAMFPGFGYIAPVESDKVPQAGVLGALRGGAAQASGLFQRFAFFRRNKVALFGAGGALVAFVVYLVVSSSIHARHVREAAAAGAAAAKAEAMAQAQAARVEAEAKA